GREVRQIGLALHWDGDEIADQPLLDPGFLGGGDGRPGGGAAVQLAALHRQMDEVDALIAGDYAKPGPQHAVEHDRDDVGLARTCRSRPSALRCAWRPRA